jgi:hypothetical protein
MQFVLADLCEAAIERAVGDHDHDTLRRSLDLQGAGKPPFEPGMTVWLNR